MSDLFRCEPGRCEGALAGPARRRKRTIRQAVQVSRPASDVLALLEVRGLLSRRLEASGRWALRFPSYRHMKFGGVIEGCRWIWIESVTEPRRRDPSDFYLLSHGGPYCFASDVTAKPFEGVGFMAEHLQADGVVRYDGGDGRSVGAGGHFVFDDEMSGLLLTSLPPLLHIRADAPQARALRSVLELISFETETARPGAGTIAAALCSVVLGRCCARIFRQTIARGDG